MDIIKIARTVATGWLSILIAAVLVCIFGLITYAAYWYRVVRIDLFQDMFAPKKYDSEAMAVIWLMALSIVTFTLAIFLGHAIIFVPISLCLQIVAVGLSVDIGFMTTEKGKDHYKNLAQFKYNDYHTEQFQEKYGCSGLTIAGCQENCCEEQMDSVFDSIFQKDRYFFWLPVVWLIIMSVLLPSLLLYWYFNQK